MATTLGQPSRAAPPQPPVAPGALGSARAALAARESPRRRIVRLLLLLSAVAVLVKGWMVTDINLGMLTNAPNAAPILKSLLQPDVAAREITQVELQVPFTVGVGSSAAAVVTDRSGQTLRINPGSASPGETVVNAPTGNLHPSDTLVASLSRIGETILLALMGTVFGVLFSAPLSFLGARNLMGGSPLGRSVYWVVRVIFTITRSIEVLILGVIMVVIVGIGSYAGVLAIVVHSIGSLGKLYSEAIEGIEPGPVEAITATGANRLSTVVYGVVPQVIPTFLAVTIFWWDHNVRMSTVLGLVGGGGIGYLLIQYMNLLQFNQAATVLWMIVIVVTVMDYASAAIRSRLV